jgi:hypothetical protein
MVAKRRRAQLETAGIEETETAQEARMKAKEPRKKPGHRLRIFFDEKTGEVNIEGNRAGLEYLAEVCRSVIGQSPGPNHWHLSEAFDTLDQQSLEVIVCYRGDFETVDNDANQTRSGENS